MGCFATALLGIGGSIVGGFIGNAIWPVAARDYASPHRLLHFMLAVIGAIVLLGFVACDQKMMIRGLHCLHSHAS